MRLSSPALLVGLLLSAAGAASAQTPTLVADINKTPSGGIPSAYPQAYMSLPDVSWNFNRFPRIGASIFFRAQGLDPKTGKSKGYELYAWFPGATAMPVGAANGSNTIFSGTDPVIGGTMKLSFDGAPAGTGGLVLFGAPTRTPLLLAGSGLYFNLSRIFGILPVTVAGGKGSLSISVPNSPALTGHQLATQGFVAPTSTPPFGVDLCRGVLLTFGK